MALLDTIDYGGTTEPIGSMYAKLNLAIGVINSELGAGTTGQYLKKSSNTDFDIAWETTSFATEAYADAAADAAEAAAIASSNGYTDSLVQRHYVYNTIATDRVTKSSTSGVITTYNSGAFYYSQQGNVCYIFGELNLDLSNSWLAGDYLRVSLNVDYVDSVTSSATFRLAAPLYESRGMVSVDDDSAAAKDGYFYVKATSVGIFDIVFKRDVSDPTGVNGKFQFAVTYLTDVI